MSDKERTLGWGVIPTLVYLEGRGWVSFEQLRADYLNSGVNGRDEEKINILANNFSRERQVIETEQNPKQDFEIASGIHERALVLEKAGVKLDGEELKRHSYFVQVNPKFIPYEVILPQNRRDTHFHIDEEVWVFVGPNVPEHVGVPRFVKAVVDYACDEVVYFTADEKWNREKFKGGRAGKANLKSFEILLVSEYEHLVNHPEELSRWLDKIIGEVVQ